MKILYSILLFFVFFFSTNCSRQIKIDSKEEFAIYLSSTPKSYIIVHENPYSLTHADVHLNEIKLEKKPFITEMDIKCYNSSNCSFVLNKDISLGKYRNRIFVVCLGGKRMFWGPIWSEFSSISFPGIYLIQPFRRGKNKIFIGDNYPSKNSNNLKNDINLKAIEEHFQKMDKLYEIRSNDYERK